jgi:hypothetical protein
MCAVSAVCAVSFGLRLSKPPKTKMYVLLPVPCYMQFDLVSFYIQGIYFFKD